VTDKLVFFTGAGVSAESGLRTFRDMGGLWNEYAVEDVASPAGWRKNPSVVLDFYNERRRAVLAAQPNAAHLAIAALERKFEVVVITQNIDDLHERAGSSKVIHVHGEILKARSTVDPALTYRMSKASIELGELCEKGSQLRPDVVWFGENVRFMEDCEEQLASATRVVVVGTSLSVYPAAGLVSAAPFKAEKYLVSPETQKLPYGFKFLRGTAAAVIPHIATCWLDGRRPA
jgi:NAD-dependent deacetylase